MTANGIPPPYLLPLTPKIYFTADRFSRQLFNIQAHPRAHSPPQAHRLGIGVFNRTATTASGDISEFYSLSKHLSVSSLFFYLPFSAAARPPTEWRVVARICKSNKFIWIEIELAPFVHVMMSAYTCFRCITRAAVVTYMIRAVAFGKMNEKQVLK